MNVQHFSIPVSQFDVKLLPSGCRETGTAAFGEAVMRYFAGKYEGSGLSVLVEIHDAEIRVVAFPSAFSDPMDVALALLSQRDIKEALPILEPLARQRRDEPEILYNLGIAYSELGEYDRAVMTLKQLLAIDPVHANGLVGLGVAYQRLGQSPQALEYLKKAVQVDPSNPYAQRNLGSVMASGGDLAGALAHLRKAHELAPDDPAAMFGLAKCLEQLGDAPRVSQACVLFKQIIDQFPGTRFDDLARESRTAIAGKNMRSAVQGGLRPDVMMYIADAMDTFARLGDEKRQAIGFEIAMLGTKGLDINDPAQKYQLKSLPGNFSGLHLTAIMYAAFRQMNPSLDTGVDYSKEYAAAASLRARNS